MRRIPFALALLLILAAIALWGLSLFTGIFQDDIQDAPASDRTFTLEPVLSGFDRPTFALGTDDGIYILEQPGRIRFAPNGSEPILWLDLSGRISAQGVGGERGLLGFAIAPGGDRFYVHYTDNDGDTVLSRFPMPTPGGLPDAEDEEILLQVDQPYPNHNGGMLAFGPDGMLYMGLGDGGLAGDPHDNAQDPTTLLGSILRLDVSPSSGYAVPADNPFADGKEGRPEVWAYGLRNPWRFHFDAATGDLWIGDVGQDHIEEVDRIPAGQGGLDFGWPDREGSQPYGPRGGKLSGTVLPVAEYDHDGGHCSVTGGPVARGPAWEGTGLEGVVFYADYCSGVLWTLEPDGTGGWDAYRVLETGKNVSSFGQGPDGTIYVVDRGGGVYRLTTVSRE